MRNRLLNIFLIAIFFCLILFDISIVEGANEYTLKDKVEGIAVTEKKEEVLEVAPISYTVKLGSGHFTPSVGIHVNKSLKVMNMADTDSIYCLIQFYQDNHSIEDYYYLKESGVKILSYVPENTYYAKIPLSWLDTPPSFVRWIGTLNPEQKIDPSLKDEINSRPSNKQEVIVNFFEPLTNEKINILKQSSIGDCISDEIVGSSTILVTANRTEILELANFNFVKWITRKYEKTLCLDRSVNLISADNVWTKGNRAQDITVGVIDSGLQYDFNNDNMIGGENWPTHPHFSGITAYASYDYVDDDWVPEDDNTGTVDAGHGTHCAGIISGSSTYNQRSLIGVSSNANLVVERIFGPDLNGDRRNDFYYDVGDSGAQMWRYIIDPDRDGDVTEDSSADVVSCSWGGGIGYDSWAENHDRAVKGAFGKEVIACFAAGNEGSNVYVTSDASAKNVITVGACADFRDSDNRCQHGWEYDENNQYVMEYSQRGTPDGRVKPDILAPGSDITSSTLNSQYVSWDGTSMATPHVAAVAAQILHEYPDASPALVKAFIISSAVDGGTTDAPSIDRAWGRLNALSSVYKLPDEVVDSYDENTVGNLLSLQPRERYYTINVPNDAAKLIVTLVYSDDPADPSGDQTAPKLVNDLDLFLVDPSGNELYRNDDAVNNVEKYVIDNPEAGNWEAHVRVVDLADLGGLLPKSQDYAIAMIVIKESEEPSTSITPHHNVTLCTSTNNNMMVAVGDCFEVWCNVSCKGLSCYNVFCNVTSPTEGMTLLSDEFDGSGEEYDLLGDIPVSVSRSSRHWIYRADTIGKYKINISVYGERADGSEIHNSTNITVNVVTKQRFVIEKGLCWLRSRQNPDGSWQHNVGITSLAVLAFLNAGYNESDETVANAIKYITNHVHSDGSIYGDYYRRNYETSLAILALVATHNESYNQTIENAKNWLLASQWDEDCLWGRVDKNNWYYGGFGYGRNIRPDLSNTQFALMALDAAGVPKDDPVWAKAQVFLARCQNRQADVYIPELNYTVHWNPSYNKYNDGGFVYYPGHSLAEDVKSYGSMTGAGLWCLKLCGVPNSDPRVQAALDWVRNHYTWEGNPGMPDPTSFQYYYYLTMSKALVMTVGIDGEINEHKWYDELVNKLVELQKPEGYWQNPNSRAWENIPELVTAYAILSMEYRYIPTEVERLSWITFILHSNADLHVYDPLGRHVGINYQTGEMENEIPNATVVYTETEQMITVPQLKSGDYRVVLVGTGDGEYELTIRAGVGNETVKEESYRRTISKGETHEAKVGVAMIAGLTITIEEPETPTNYVIQTATRRGNATFIPDKGEIEGLRAINESDLPEEGKPALQFPFGFFSFNITGLNPNQTVNITIAFPQNIPTTAQYWKYGPNGSIDNPQPERWYQIPMGSNDGDNIITITLQDGGIGDDDGVANGVIVDQGGPGIPTAVARVPTLTPIGITALAGLLLIIGISRIKKRK